MLSPGYARQLAQEAAIEAAELHKTPFVYFNADEVDELKGFPFPFLGDYVPEGWELVEEFFVDSSGSGAPGEPALTGQQFADRIKEILVDTRSPGWAITEVGQFQVYVGRYQRT